MTTDLLQTYATPPDYDATPPWELDPDSEPFNIASYLPARAAERPFQKAVVMPAGYNRLGKREYGHLTFAQLDRLCDAYAHGLRDLGVERGDRVLLMVRQGLELIALTFALFKLGAVPVLIDPGMGRDRLLDCIEHVSPRVLIGIPLAHLARLRYRRAFGSVDVNVITEGKWWTGASALDDIADFDAGQFTMVETGRDDMAAILFTSGSTGPAKGVHYTHGIFDAQTRAIRDTYDIEPGEVAVPGFPLFALFSTAMGMTCVVPDMDPAAPADVEPACIVEAIHDHGATMAFGSPAIWEKVGRFCEREGLQLPSITRLLTFGAPISPALMERYTTILVDGAIHTPYGATEALPVASISSDDVLAETAAETRLGRGICVGEPVGEVDVRVIEITDDPLDDWSNVDVLPSGGIGEICVRGRMVTPAYDRRPEQTRLAKIPDPSRGDGAFWHRMGDVGYLDDDSRLWFCGRKSHRVETPDGPLFTVPCEAIFNEHPDVFRSALVGPGRRGEQVPMIVVEPESDRFPSNRADEERFREELLSLAADHALTRSIENVFFRRSFPVDRRHNAKIHRGELTRWIE